LPVKGGKKEKQTNEIKTATPLLESLDIQGKTITADALLTQCELAEYIVQKEMRIIISPPRAIKKNSSRKSLHFSKMFPGLLTIQPRISPTMAEMNPEGSGSGVNLCYP